MNGKAASEPHFARPAATEDGKVVILFPAPQAPQRSGAAPLRDRLPPLATPEELASDSGEDDGGSRWWLLPAMAGGVVLWALLLT